MIYPVPNLFVVVAFAGLFVLYCLLIGWSLLRLATPAFLAKPGNPTFELFLSVATGFLAAMSAASLLGALGLCTRPAVTAYATLSAIAAWFALRGRWVLTARRDWRAAALLIVLCIAAVALSLRPPGSSWDDTMYHLPVARDIARSGAIGVDPSVRFPLFPQAQEALMAVGLLFAGESAAAFLSTIPLVFTIIGMVALAGLFKRRWTVAFTATLLLYALPEIRFLLGFAYVDLAVGLFGLATLSLIILYEQSDRTDRKLLWLAGAMAGGACSVKYVGLPFAAITALYLALTIRRVRPVVEFVGASLVIGGGWYIRSAWVAGDPFHPFGATIFGFYLWDRQDLLDQALEQRSIVAHSPLPEPFGLLWRKWGVIALAMPALTAVLWKYQRMLRPIMAIGCTYLAVWVLTSKDARYLTPVIGSLCVVVGVAASVLLPTMLRGMRDRFEIAAPWLMAIATVAIAGRALTGAELRLRHWSDSQAGMLGLRAYAEANKEVTRRGGRILQLGFENGKDFAQSQAIGDRFGPWRYRNFARCSTVAATVKLPCPLIAADRMRRLMTANQASVAIVNLKVFQLDGRDYGRLFELRRTAADQLLLLPRRDQPIRPIP